MSCQWTPLTTEMADALLQGGGWGEFGELTGAQSTVLKKEIRDGLAMRFKMTIPQVTELLAKQANGGIDTETALHQTSKDMLLFARMPDGTPYIWVVSCFEGDATRKTDYIPLVGASVLVVALLGTMIWAGHIRPRRSGKRKR